MDGLVDGRVGRYVEGGRGEKGLRFDLIHLIRTSTVLELLEKNYRIHCSCNSIVCVKPSLKEKNLGNHELGFVYCSP